MWFQHLCILVQVRYRAECGVLGRCWGRGSVKTHTFGCSRTGCGVLGGCWGCVCGIGWMQFQHPHILNDCSTLHRHA